MIEVQEPSSSLEWDAYYKIRWEILRKPLGLKKGSERDDLENKAIHRLIKHGNERSLRELGLIRQEGKTYVVKVGDCIFFKFNV